jgi:long-chain fatty acid transport protein
MCRATKNFGLLLLTIVPVLFTVVSVQGQGIALTGVGPVNRSMAGAGTAAPLDSIGALHWNPGSISGLPSSELAFGLELLLVDAELTTTIGGSTVKTGSEPGVAAIPTIGWVQHVEGTPLTVGLGIGAIAGFRNNQPAGPAFAPLGITSPVFADAEFLQIAPTISWALNERLSIGFAPTVTAAKITLNPLGPSAVTPAALPGSGNRLHWGGGAQVGLYYIADNCWHFGATLKSPQFFEDFRFFTPAGVATLDLDYPMIISVGAAYSGIKNLTLAADLRYFDYKNTEGFSEFGYRNIFAAAFGVQYRVNDCCHVRFGYNFNANPLSQVDALTNIATPLIQDQNISAGVSHKIAANVDLNLAYVYLVTNHLTGPLPTGPLDTLTHEVEAHSAVLGLTVRY